MTTSMDNTADLVRAVLDELAPVVGAITAEQRHRPTPCAAYDVGQLCDHVLGWLDNFAAGFADPGGQAPRLDMNGYHAPADAAEAAALVGAAADRLDRAIRAGAADRPLRLGDNAMPGPLALGLILWEYQVHGWDLARATGQSWSVPMAAPEESLQFAPTMLGPDYRGDGKAFGNPVAVLDTAPPLDRLIGLSGRDPSWSPA